MVVQPTHVTCYLVEADVIEPCKRSTFEIVGLCIWNEELFLPSHEEILIFKRFLMDIALIENLFNW